MARYDYDSTNYYRARYYDPSIGRFISEDPTQFGGGINFFAYVGNAPTNFVDPSGLMRTAQNIKCGVYSGYQKKINDCIKTVFGPDGAKVVAQTIADAPIINTSMNSDQLGKFSVKGETKSDGPAWGYNDPDRGRYGTIYIASNHFYKDSLVSVYRTYVHELGNILDGRLHPNDPWSVRDFHYGKKDYVDTDTGMQLEICVFNLIFR